MAAKDKGSARADGRSEAAHIAASHALDPTDWGQFRIEAHKALDNLVDRLAAVGEGPVWRKAPADVRSRFDAPLPRAGRTLGDVLADFDANIAPYSTGNTHPMFMGWVHGAGTPYGMLGEMLAAGLNANCGGRDHIAIEVERQIARWAAEAFGFPREASGIFVTGTSMANFLAVRVALVDRFGEAARRAGIRGLKAQPVGYTSAEAHGCVNQAFELSGLGGAQLRQIAVDAEGAMDAGALAAAIANDRARGLDPFMLVGTAGTVNTGAIDDLELLADIAKTNKLWFHIDAAFGALAVLSPNLKPLLKGLEQAQSIAFDFHKWAHVPYDAGFLLVGNPKAHRQAFASPVAYLSRAPDGLAAGETWPCDLGPDLSRGFRALKAWITFQTLGADRIGAAIEGSCRVAKYLEAQLKATGQFEVVAPVALNIVCWRVKGAKDDRIHERIMMELHEKGIAAPSITRLDGRPALRAAIVNHRTRETHIDALMEAMTAIAKRLGAR